MRPGIAADYGGFRMKEGLVTRMRAILNGLSLSQLRPYGSGFLIFSDYARPSLRLSA